VIRREAKISGGRKWNVSDLRNVKGQWLKNEKHITSNLSNPSEQETKDTDMGSFVSVLSNQIVENMVGASFPVNLVLLTVTE
jgi:hypothetical protein